MSGLEDVLATSGFWLCMILLIFRSAIKERILNAPHAPAKNTAELAEMKTRLQALESRISIMNTEILELREVQDFDRRLLARAEKPILPASKAITTSAAASGRLTLPQR